MSTLPKSLVLNYVAAGVTAPRVRTVAFWTLMIIGIIWCLAGVGVVCYSTATVRFNPWQWTWYVISGTVPSYTYRVPSRSQMLVRLLDIFLFRQATLFALLIIAVGASHVAITVPIRRGRRWATVIAMLIVVFSFLGTLFTSVSFFCTAVMALVPIGTPHVDPRIDPPAHLWFFVPSILALFMTLVSIDLLGYLRWIFRNPIAEKPAKKFIG